MARLGRKSPSKSTSPIRRRNSRFFNPRPESPPSSEQTSLNNRQPAISREQKGLSTFFSSWPTRSAPTVENNTQDPNSASHTPLNLSGYRIVGLPVFDYDQTPTTSKRPRLPRHVPIIIPDYAHPFTPENCATTSEDVETSHSTPSTPRLRREERLLTPSDKSTFKPIFTNPAEDSPTCPNATIMAMNGSQISLTNSEASLDGSSSAHPDRGENSNIGISPAANQQQSGPTNLSGLVCNVHRTTGKEPNALVGATTTILGDKLFVFGGRIHSRSRPRLTNDLYELDLIRRHWSKIDTVGDVPPPRYFHSVCALGDSKLVCYGGMSPVGSARQTNGHKPTKSNTEHQPEVVVMSDIHVYDVPSRTWTLISTPDHSQNPQGRYAHCACILPSSAVFTSPNAPLSAIHHNPPSADPHSGKLGVELDGSGGAEMVVVGGQDSANNYIEQISVFNLRSLKWTTTTGYDRKCGAYKSMVVPMTGLSAHLVGQDVPLNESQTETDEGSQGTSMLIYSNYNFLDVKLELQIRLPDGSMIERAMKGQVSPPGLRFPNGGILDSHFVVSGTYLTSSKHEYALWALDLKSLTWGRIDTNGSVFSHGSWNRGVLWNRRNTFIILGHRKRNLVDDYNHRRINFSHVCMVELEAFGLYDNPRKVEPTSGYLSVSAPNIPTSLHPTLPTQSAGGRSYTSTAEQLGEAALGIKELCDMDLIAMGGERVPCNSHILSRRWGPYFNQLLLESATSHDSAGLSDAATLRPSMHSQASRYSSVTITPSVANGVIPSHSTGGRESILDSNRPMSRATVRTIVELPTTTSIPATARPRSLYLPHTLQTIQLLLHFLYTSSLPPVGTQMCTPHTLCSLLQMARPYQVDGLLEATVQRLHEVLDGRNAAAVFNAAAMAAGGGRGCGVGAGGTLETLARRASEATSVDNQSFSGKGIPRTTNLSRMNGTQLKGHEKTDSVTSASTTNSDSASTDVSQTDTESSTRDGTEPRDKGIQEIWTGDVSSVIGLQKRGLRGLMEGRRLRERANTVGSTE